MANFGLPEVNGEKAGLGQCLVQLHADQIVSSVMFYYDNSAGDRVFLKDKVRVTIIPSDNIKRTGTVKTYTAGPRNTYQSINTSAETNGISSLSLLAGSETIHIKVDRPGFVNVLLRQASSVLQVRTMIRQ